MRAAIIQWDDVCGGWDCSTVGRVFTNTHKVLCPNPAPYTLGIAAQPQRKEQNQNEQISGSQHVWSTRHSAYTDSRQNKSTVLSSLFAPLLVDILIIFQRASITYAGVLCLPSAPHWCCIADSLSSLCQLLTSIGSRAGGRVNKHRSQGSGVTEGRCQRKDGAR